MVVSLLTVEAASHKVETWLALQEPDGIAISDWVSTEFSSALAIKYRNGAITQRALARASATFATLAAESFTILPFGSRQFNMAAAFAARHALGLRAGDALHLAICAAHGATLCTLNTRQAKAAVELGFLTVEP